MRIKSITTLLLISAGLLFADDKPVKSACEDNISTIATVSPKLDSPLYHETKTSLNWWVVEHEDGSLENTMDSEIGPDELVRIENTANCTSTHQGKHLMKFCEAFKVGENIHLILSGGMPAYASDLNVIIEPNLSFRCAFSATYPNDTNSLQWKITKKELRLKSRNFTPGHRLFGWISVTFEERDSASAPPQTYKIEGYFKPVIQHKP